MKSVLRRVRSLFTRPDQPFPDLPAVTLRPIGVIRNSVLDPQPPGFDWGGVTSRIVVRPDLTDALLGLETYSHLNVLFWPHLIPADVIGSKHRLHPRDDPQNPLQGILATRSQIRFNPILVTAVPLLSIKGDTLKVRGLDAIDGTPVLDIKPYFPHFDSIPDAKVPSWVAGGQETGNEK
ncbi:MAG TPA: tRNA (N6-threonylcarbamoyladenosine(37)-N6)-methyltransferase TrmO [Dehalococcoidia bacterium]|nr:tRNA (N6-threonylcarbamoyladenosine(37)-N6)-methyltransferase TrmO [Dehalococcoidia bacterium]